MEIDYWTNQWWFVPFLAFGGPFGGPGGPGGFLGGQENPKLSISIWTKLSSEMLGFGPRQLVTLCFWYFRPNRGPWGQKRQIWAKIGYAEKCYFPKAATSNFVHIAPKYMFWTIFQYEILIFSGTHQKFFTTADFVNFDPRWPKPTCGLYDGPEGSKWSWNTSHMYNT